MVKGYLGLEITSTKIRYVLLDQQGKKLEVLNSGSTLLKLDPSSPGALTKTIQDILSRESISPKMIFLSLARQETLVREIVVPKMNLNELVEVLTGEIEKLPNFANRPYDYIYEKYPAVKDKSRLIYAAVDRRLLDYLLEETKKTKIPFKYFDTAPLNLKELVYLVEDSGKNEALLVVNDKVSHLIIYQNHQFKFLYKTTTGTDDLFPGGTPNDPVFANFAAELQRVIKSFLLDSKTETLEHVWLVHDQVAAPNLLQQVKDKLSLKVDSFSFSRILNCDISKGGDNPINLIAATPVIYHLKNLKPQFSFTHFFHAFHAQKMLAKTLFVNLLYIATVVVLLGGLTLNFYNKEQVVQKKNFSLAQETAQLQTEADKLYKQYEEYFRIRQGLLDQATYIQILNRTSWTEVFSIVADRMPEEMSLTSFKLTEQGTTSFKGESFKIETIAELLRRVDVSPILQSGKFDFLTERMVDEQKVFSYGILAQLKSLSPTQPPTLPATAEGKKNE